MLGRDQYQALLDGAQITLQVSALAILWGTVAAVVLGVVSLSPFRPLRWRSEEHTSELQSLMRNSYLHPLSPHSALPIFPIIEEFGCTDAEVDAAVGVTVEDLAG